MKQHLQSRKKENEEKHLGTMRLIEEESRRKVQKEFLHANDYLEARYLENIARYAPIKVDDGEPEDIDDHTGLPCPARPDHSTNTVDYILGPSDVARTASGLARNLRRLPKRAADLRCARSSNQLGRMSPRTGNAQYVGSDRYAD